MNIWDEALAHLRERLDAQEFRRWFSETAYASDAGDHITVWIPTEAMRRHIGIHYQNDIDEALAAAGRPDTAVRFVVTGIGDDEESEY